jgi:hypothetical protein
MRVETHNRPVPHAAEKNLELSVNLRFSKAADNNWEGVWLATMQKKKECDVEGVIR